MSGYLSVVDQELMLVTQCMQPLVYVETVGHFQFRSRLRGRVDKSHLFEKWSMPFGDIFREVRTRRWLQNHLFMELAEIQYIGQISRGGSPITHIELTQRLQ
jgi:hypothetical protein